MPKREVTTGYSKNGLPYFRIGSGPRDLVVIEGLNFAHKPLSGLGLRMMSNSFGRFAEDFTVYYAGRKPGLPEGYSIRDMSDDYANMIRDEMRVPVDLMGISTGGAIAQCFAADHPELVRRLVLGSTGYRLSEGGAELQRKVITLVRQGKWRSAAAVMAGGMASGVTRPIVVAFFWVLGKSMFGAPDDPSDGLVELEAEDRFDFGDRLADVNAPTLVIGGEDDCFYPIGETAAGIPSAKLILYGNTGHMAMIKRQFNRDILAFLTEATA
jgi:pimeloyl-ACP methyl ester carboxylesterase